MAQEGEVDAQPELRQEGLPAVQDAEAMVLAARPLVLSICASLLGNRLDAEDATQETLIRVARHLERLRGDATAYIATVARHVCSDERHRRTRRHERESQASAPGSMAACPSAEDTVITRQLIARAWDKMSTTERQLMSLTFAGLTLDEIAAHTGMRPDAVAQRISRTRRRLRGALRDVPAVVLAPFARRLRSVMRHVGALGNAAPAVALAGADQLGVLLVGTALLASIASPAGGAPPPSLGAGLGTSAASRVSAAGPGIGGASAGANATAIHVTPTTPPAQTTPDSGHPLLPAGFPGGPPSNATPDNTQVYAFTASPSYAEDHTVFAAGAAAVFRSNDGGATWQTLGSAGFQGEQIILPPSYPTDPRIFAVDPTRGLIESDNGGKTFAPAAPEAVDSPVAMDDSSPPGHARLLFLAHPGQGPLLVYDAGSRTTMPGPALPVTTETISSLVSGPGTGDVFITAASVTGQPQLLECTVVAGACRVIPDPAGWCQLVASPAFASDHLLFAISEADDVVVWQAGQSQATHLPPPVGGQVRAVFPHPDYPTTNRLLAIGSPDRQHPQAESQMLSTGEQPFATFPSGLDPTRMSVAALAVLPDGRMLVPSTSIVDGQVEGVECSTDGGMSWRSRC